MDIIAHIAETISARQQQVSAAVELLDDGATVPFIARYRKEVTGGLDDIQLRALEQRLVYLRDLNQRRDTILDSIETQGKLTPELAKAIAAADTKTILEDLYLPYKPKRRSKAQTAREAGLEPLASSLLENHSLTPSDEAVKYINPDNDIPDTDTALEGARQILMEKMSEQAGLLQQLRDDVWRKGILTSTIVKNKEQEGAKFRDYFDYSEALSKIPSHRALALFRGRNEGILRISIKVSAEEEKDLPILIQKVAHSFAIKQTGNAADKWLTETVNLAWKIKLFPRIDLDLKLRLREASELEAIKVFANNMRDLLLAAPAGPRITLGLDPGIRTGVKVAVVDSTGKVLDTSTIYPHPPKKQWSASIQTLKILVEKHQVDLIAIGNGTGSRETDKLAIELIKSIPNQSIHKLIVSEAGASVYSASALASEELPDLDVSLRGAVSIARRIQDPLAELVKIDQKSIGVGQYQHDVNQVQLGQNLNAVVEDCVNAVGVNLNTASVSLLKQVSGLSPSIAKNIVQYRNEQGAFNNRTQLKKVPRLGEKAFEQAAGFLRITEGENPLDASSVHPEAYPVVTKIMQYNNKPISELMGQAAFLKTLDASQYTDEQFGLPTVTDILLELEKPGHDPRPEFKSPSFKEGVETISDLEPGMRLEGSITNITNFGAFVDIGVHQDGLVHISHIADHFVKDPHSVVKTGDLVKATVLEVDVQRKRISLSMKSSQDVTQQNPQKQPKEKRPRSQNKQTVTAKPKSGTLADAFARARKQ